MTHPDCGLHAKSVFEQRTDYPVDKEIARVCFLCLRLQLGSVGLYGDGLLANRDVLHRILVSRGCQDFLPAEKRGYGVPMDDTPCP